MKILNIGAPEVILIVLLALVIFGPKRLVQVMRDVGKWLRSISKSPIVRDFVRTTEDIRKIPNELIRESGLDQDLKEVQRAAQEATRIDEISAERAKQNEPKETPPEDAAQSILPPAPPAESDPQNPA
jgi:Sec-independent protein translocase protein TatA